jgi:cell fate regulator YaaT (PSP1 superfamily)
MLNYIEASGGKNYPFTTKGRVQRVATAEDLIDQAQLDARKGEILRFGREIIREMDLPMKLVDVEMLLGGERIIFHYTSDQWVDFRELVQRLASEFQTRIEMHQVNARDEARLVADYEKCGQHCCCRQFLKVLKPVSMRSAKVQKATLDPQKISGRCGRLMCCLRYEDKTYDELRKRLPHKQTRVMTEDGPGTVIDTQILTQLALVRLDRVAKLAAYPIENIQKLTKEEDAAIQAEAEEAAARLAARQSTRRERPKREFGQGPVGRPLRDEVVPRGDVGEQADVASDEGPSDGSAQPASADQASGGPTESGQPTGQEDSGDKGRRGKRRRGRRGRRKRRGGSGSGGQGGGGDGGSGGGGGAGGPA